VELHTGIGTASVDKITFYGLDLCADVIGKLDLGSFTYLCATGRPANRDESDLLTAVMLASADHGLTPSSIATRLTYVGAPESPQAAIAAGLLGGGSVYLGASEMAGQMLARLRAYLPDSDVETVAATEVARARAASERLPGFGHPIHRLVDPRTTVLFQLARERGYFRTNCELIDAVHRQLSLAVGRPVTLNAAGSSAAILMDLGLEPTVLRLIALAARSIGLISHIREEASNPIADGIWHLVLQNTTYI